MELRAEAVRWVDDEPFPGVVEVRFTDAEGHQWSLVDKAPIFDADGVLGPDSAYPLEVGVACVIVGSAWLQEDGERVTVSTTPHGVAARDGRDEFTVRRDQLTC
ncbi:MULTISPECIES: hypothetical protein [unclassified Streptomyces]|uniref:hypothetical protein n=1 Tax=unclassified Streptomyces TaxID=2593676 RepID=UPI00090941AE|nr:MULTISPECIES: hypothetical protein [unclassified Streptomyces]MDR6981379.1 hypothetical protein [Streptomyces sp. 3330]SHH36073.1 hypothetical protein SAMN05444521_0243 [Streptomyces sp. 3214.6]SHH98337.1 hypothetical protein SAMN05444521_3034 [Streptomyces sp. 3214.6]